MITNRTVGSIGIIGGHGYNAAIHFQKELSDEFNKKNVSRKYLKTYVINNSLSYSDNEQYDCIYDNKNNQIFENEIKESYYLLKNSNVNLIVIPCNTFSFYLSNIKDDVKCLNIVEETSNYINQMNDIGKLGIIATKQTITNKLYQKKLTQELFFLPELLNDVSKIIFCVQYGYYDKSLTQDFLKQYNLENNIQLIDLFNKIVDKYVSHGVTHLLLGCTELPLFYEYNKDKIRNNITYISSTNLLAKSCIQYLT